MKKAVAFAAFPAAALIAATAFAQRAEPPFPMEYSQSAVNFEPSKEEAEFIKAVAAMFPEGAEFATDPRLCLAAREHAASLAGLASMPKRLDAGGLRPLIWKYGIAEFQYVPISLTVRDVAADAAAVGQFVTSSASEGYLTCGSGMAARASGKGFVATLICMRRNAEIGSIPRALAVGSSIVVRGKLVAGYGRPRVFVSQPSGLVSKVEPARDGGSFSASVSFPAPGKYIIEVMVSGSTGPEIAAMAPVYIEMKSEEIAADLLGPLSEKDQSKGVDAPEAERMLREAVAMERKKMGLTTLAADETLSRVAREKSKAMSEKRKFGHNISKTSLDGALKAAGVDYKIAGENIAIDSSPKMGHYMFMNSPAHRANILNANMTHVGIGVARAADAGEYFMTQIFIRRETDTAGDDAKAAR